MQQPNHGNLLAQRVAIDAVRLLRPLVERIHRHDRSLADQLKRAASSVVLNLAEAAYNNAGHRRSRLESARGSANEARAALAVANAWGYIGEQQAAEVDALYNRVLAMTYPLWARAQGHLAAARRRPTGARLTNRCALRDASLRVAADEAIAYAESLGAERCPVRS